VDSPRSTAFKVWRSTIGPSEVQISKLTLITKAVNNEREINDLVIQDFSKDAKPVHPRLGLQLNQRKEKGEGGSPG
jgi:hypothetical protein